MFTDHFGAVAGDYARSRPTYPAELFEWLAAQCRARECAWDCGTGSGQAARDLARYFASVVATDASAAQIGAAAPHECIRYQVAAAEASGLPEASADLVVVAQALHWFDRDRFYAEARRVLKREGVIAAWCYGEMRAEVEAVDREVARFYHEVVGPHWPPERRHVEAGYRDLAFPFARLAAPSFAMRAAWELGQMLGYVGSWSATARFREARGFDPLPELAARLRAVWGETQQRLEVRWPLALLVGRNT